jgi:hypothetical protein
MMNIGKAYSSGLCVFLDRLFICQLMIEQLCAMNGFRNELIGMMMESRVGISYMAFSDMVEGH